MAKLTSEQIEARNSRIIAHFKGGLTTKAIGSLEGLHHGNVAKIIKVARQAGELPGIEKSNGRAAEKIVDKMIQQQDKRDRAASTRSASRKAFVRKRPGKRLRAMRKIFKAGKNTKANKRSIATKARKRSGLSLIDAAVLILRKSKTALHPKVIVEIARKRKLYRFGKGKTPFATLWSNLLGEIAMKKGKKRVRNPKSRFKLAKPGHFTLTSVGRKGG